MNIQVARGVQREFDEACRQYALSDAGILEDFRRKTEDGLLEVSRHPFRWPILEQDVRRFLLTRFPYAILYQVSEDHVYILAIIHLARRPGYWRRRRP